MIIELDPPEDLSELEEELDYTFNDKDLLITSLCHRSIQNTADVDDSVSNERLEFLGDSVLGLIISEFLFHQYPNQREGELTKLKGLLVSEVVLYKIAQNIDLGKFVFMSKEEELSGGRNRKTILSDAYEAVLGAMYLDGSMDDVRNAVRIHLLENFEDLVSNDDYINYKGRLLEYTQGQNMGVPRYEVIDESGPEHRKIFNVVAKVMGHEMGYGRGHTKKQAEQQAAKIAMRSLKLID